MLELMRECIEALETLASDADEGLASAMTDLAFRVRCEIATLLED